MCVHHAPGMAFTIPKLAPAATAPMTKVCSAPLMAVLGLTRTLLTYPKISRVVKVTAIEMYKASNASLRKKYGIKGIKPPSRYDTPIVKPEIYYFQQKSNR